MKMLYALYFVAFGKEAVKPSMQKKEKLIWVGNKSKKAKKRDKNSNWLRFLVIPLATLILSGSFFVIYKMLNPLTVRTTPDPQKTKVPKITMAEILQDSKKYEELVLKRFYDKKFSCYISKSAKDQFQNFKFIRIIEGHSIFDNFKADFFIKNPLINLAQESAATTKDNFNYSDIFGSTLFHIRKTTREGKNFWPLYVMLSSNNQDILNLMKAFIKAKIFIYYDHKRIDEFLKETTITGDNILIYMKYPELYQKA